MRNFPGEHLLPLRRAGGDGASGTEYAIVRRTTQMTAIVTATDTPVTFESADQNPAGMWSAGAPTRLTAITSGLFIAGGTVHWDVGSAGYRMMARVVANGTTTVAYNEVGTLALISYPSFSPTALVYLSAGQYVQITVQHTKGSNHQLVAGVPAFGWICKVGG